MKVFDIDWRRFFAALPAWRALPRPARRALLDHLKPTGSFPAGIVKEHRDALAGAGLVVGVNDWQKVRVADPYRAFLRVLQAMDRRRVFDAPRREAPADYIADYLSHDEAAALTSASWRYRSSRTAVAREVTSRRWIRGFLEADDVPAWEGERHDGRLVRYLEDPEVAGAARALVRTLVETGEPVEAADLARELGHLPGPVLARALAACLRYLLVFAALRGSDLEPLMGIWPATLERLRSRPAPPPDTVTPERTFQAAVGLGDMTLVLAAAAAEPPRLRAADFRLYARAHRELAASLTPVPQWLEEALELTPRRRLDHAVEALSRWRYAEARGKGGKDLRLAPTEAGRRWLARPEKERLKELLDHLLAARRRQAESPYADAPGLPFLPRGIGGRLWLYQVDLPAAVVDAFRSADDRGPVEVAGFLRHAAESSNPLLEATRERRPPDGLTEEQLEGMWRDQLFDFLADRLVALGGAVLAEAGGRLGFSLTGAGRYLLGLARDFEHGHPGGGRVIVQPNFEVIFLGPDAAAEAAIGRFAKRRGHGLGVLFTLTRDAVYGAAAAGMTAEEALTILEDAVSDPIPGNVRGQLASWFAACRRVRLARTLLIRCPDADTATRVISAGGRRVRPLTDTVVEVLDSKARGPLLRKLRSMGVFVDE